MPAITLVHPADTALFLQVSLRALIRAEVAGRVPPRFTGTGLDVRATPADRAEFESIARICGIGLGTTCYCQAHRDAFARGEAGVPGVGEEALGVKVVVQEEVRRPAGRARKKKGEPVEQMGPEMHWTPGGGDHED